MKKTIVILTILIFLLSFSRIFAQAEITKDTTLANRYVELARNNLNSQKYDSAAFYLEKAQPLYIKHMGENSLKNADVCQIKGLVCYRTAKNDLAHKNFFQALHIRQKLHGEWHVETARLNNYIGIVYISKAENDIALDYCLKSLALRKDILGEKHVDVAESYHVIGLIHFNKNDYEIALNYYKKSLAIRKELFGEKNINVAISYINIGNVFAASAEYDKMLEYFTKSLAILKELMSEKSPYVLACYGNLGLAYAHKKEYDKALEYFYKILAIQKELLGEKHIEIARTYFNIGYAYARKSEYDKALEFYLKVLDIRKELLGEKHTDVARCNVNIGNIYQHKEEYDKALFYILKSMDVLKELLGDKHADVASTFNSLSDVFKSKKDYVTALKYSQKAIVSCMHNFNDTVNVYSIPVIENYLDWNILLTALLTKGQILADTTKDLTSLPALSKAERHQLALRHFQACDTLLDKTRKEISGQSDKLALGELSSAIYEEAVDVCNNIITQCIKSEDQNKYKELSFYFSEKNKASVLLESLSGQQALQFAGIPDSLLAKEHDLRIDINYYKKQLADMPDSAKQTLYHERLFSFNRSYDSLIAVFETQYPDYYNLKYSETTASVPDIQKQLDESTALVSYFAGDSMITIFTITRNTFDIEQKTTPKDFTVKIDSYRRSLSRISIPGQRNYKKLAAEFYDLLIPKKPGKKIKHLIIVPDHMMATIPFETFLTKPVTDKSEMHKLPYLINQYAISYSYSATLFMKTFPKEKTKEIELYELNDWLAFAPVADTSQTGMSMASRELLQRYQNLSSDSVQTRGLRDYFAPLPGTLSEVSTILNLFDQNKAKAKIEVNKNADEKTIKSGLLKDYRILHFATHGMVHNEKPELSCILLASADSSDTENDGILYSGEIYNLKLNADLVVLSACETGLGKIKKGEGILGLTRALLYAGSRNIIVSLWQVADQSTSDMMIVFYDDLLKKGLSGSDYSKSLQQAKRYMIKNKQYAHPFYWSPFVLIGR